MDHVALHRHQLEMDALAFELRRVAAGIDAVAGGGDVDGAEFFYLHDAARGAVGAAMALEHARAALGQRAELVSGAA